MQPRGGGGGSPRRARRPHTQTHGIDPAVRTFNQIGCGQGEKRLLIEQQIIGAELGGSEGEHAHFVHAADKGLRPAVVGSNQKAIGGVHGWSVWAVGEGGTRGHAIGIERGDAAVADQGQVNPGVRGHGHGTAEAQAPEEHTHGRARLVNAPATAAGIAVVSDHAAAAGGGGIHPEFESEIGRQAGNRVTPKVMASGEKFTQRAAGGGGGLDGNIIGINRKCSGRRLIRQGEAADGIGGIGDGTAGHGAGIILAHAPVIQHGDGGADARTK